MGTRLSNRKRILFFTNIFPHYRKALWEALLLADDWDMAIYYGASIDGGVKEAEADSLPSNIRDGLFRRLDNVRINGLLAWQKGVLSGIRYGVYDVVMFTGDMNVISTWCGALWARLRRKKVVFWGHGIYGNESAIKLNLRLRFLSLAHLNIVYGDRAKRMMLERGVSNPIEVINNSLDHENQRKIRDRLNGRSKWWKDDTKDDDAIRLVFIGRLTKKKSLEILIDLLERCNSSGGLKARLMFIGDGPMTSLLRKRADKIMEQVIFAGAVYDEELIASLMWNADLCISPGNVGLTALHSMVYGTPVATHNDFAEQMPEYEAIVEGETGFFFNRNSIEDLEKKLINWFKRKDYDREHIRRKCITRIASKYTPAEQVKVFRKAMNRLNTA